MLMLLLSMVAIGVVVHDLCTAILSWYEDLAGIKNGRKLSPIIIR